MAKKGFEVSGRMSVDKFENLFLQSFGVYCDILTEDNKIAKQTDTLAVLRPEDFKGPKKIDFSLTANMLVENVIKKFEANFGISLQIYEVSKASNKSTLAALRREVILDVNDDGIQARKIEMEEITKKDRPSGKPKSTSQTVKFLFESISLPIRQDASGGGNGPNDSPEKPRRTF